MSKKYIITNITNVDPTVSDNIAAGYALAQDWFNETTGERFYHKADGVWVSYTAVGTNTESPIMFADVATTAQFNGTYDNGVGGVGATLTNTTDGSINIDGVPLNLDVVVLVKDQSYTGDPFDIDYRPQNGVYKVTQEGTPSLPVILTRVDFADETVELYPSQVNILDGTVNINKIFLQKTVDPALGTDAVLYETNLIPVTPQQILPVIFVDTATTEPLPSSTYANIYPTTSGGMWSIPYPSSATITANTNGPLGTINGVVMGNSFANRNNRILVKNQANPVHNGDYQLIQAGSSTTPWVLQRITTTGGSMVKSAREWKVNNENSTLYGTRYNLVSSSSIAIKIGISNLEYSEVTNTASIIEVTYAELVALKTGSLLIPGQTYLLTDYETVYTQPESGETISSGVIEPLYITATDTDKLSKECKSELYPQDIVYYEITGDIGNGKGTEGFTKGKIYRRIDTLRNNDIGTDWRHVKYRRWGIDVPVEFTWVSGDNYIQGDLATLNGQGIYLCIEDDTNSTISLDNNIKWIQCIYSNGEIRSRIDGGISIGAAGITGLVPVDVLTYEDSVMFPDYDFVWGDGSFGVYNNNITSSYLNNNIIYSSCTNNTILGKFENNNIETIRNCELGYNSTNNYIVYLTNCKIGANNGTDFQYNMIHGMSSNTILGAFYSNHVDVIDTNFKWNTFKNNCNYNIFSGNFKNNNVGDFFYNNILSNTVDSSNFGKEFHHNTIRRVVNHCEFGNYNSYFNLSAGNIFINWKFGNDINGGILSLPELGEEYTKKVVNANGTYVIEYIDEYGDDVITDQLVSLGFRSNQESLNISGSNISQTVLMLIEWGDGAQWTDYANSFNETHTYPGKLNTDEYGLRIANSDLQILFMSGNQLTYFNPINLPSTLETLIISSNLLTSFDPSVALPSSLDYLDLTDNQLTSFDPGIAIPNQLTSLYLDYNDLISFDPASHSLPSSLNYLGLSNNQLTGFNPSIALPNSLATLNLSFNQLTSFDPNNHALPNNVTQLNLRSNVLNSFNPSNALPSSLQYFDIKDNNLASFDPSIALPSSLIALNLGFNQLTSFDPSIALPSSLYDLFLDYNQLTSFDPSIALPSLNYLNLIGNQLTSFNPTLPLPSSLSYLNLNNNQLDTTEVNNTLVMLNTRYTTTGSKYFYLQMSPSAPPSGAGLTAKAALQAKGYQVYTN